MGSELAQGAPGEPGAEFAQPREGRAKGDLLAAFSYLMGLESRWSHTPPGGAWQKEDRKQELAAAKEISA